MRHGSMILSEFAGAAQSLNGSLLVNPCELSSVLPLIDQAYERCNRGRPIYSRRDSRRARHATGPTEIELAKALRGELFLVSCLGSS